MTGTELLLFLLTALIAGYFWSRPKYKNFPPGPRPWPVLGNLRLIMQPGKLRHEVFSSLGETYGDIIGFYYGPKPAIILNNPKHIKEAFAQNVFSGKPVQKAVKDRNKGGSGNRGIFFSEGPVWSEQRRFALKTLRDFGFGKKSMETIIMEEVDDLINSFKNHHGEAITTQNRFNLPVLNGLWAVMSGQKFSHDDPRAQKIMKILSASVTKRPLAMILASYVPLFYYIRKNFPSLFTDPAKEFQSEVYALFEETVKSHIETVQEDSPRDFIDVYLNHMKQSKDPESSFNADEGLPNLNVTLLDLFLAGAETTSNTLIWSCLILALHPELQEKIHVEIKQGVGLTRPVSLTDRPNLPYLEAVILEVLRYSALVSTGLAHKVMEDVNFHGYTLPKGAMLIPNLYKAVRSKEAWGDPDNFRPERFINLEGKCVLRNEAFMPFSTGKRICLGETMAKDELFLFMGNIFQRLKITTFDGEPRPSLEPSTVSTTILVPKDHKLVVLDRERC